MKEWKPFFKVNTRNGVALIAAGRSVYTGDFVCNAKNKRHFNLIKLFYFDGGTDDGMNFGIAI
jgi:hypothetical protein